MKEYLVLYKDVFFLYKRIKEIDRNYQLLFNLKNKHFEIHNFNQRGTSFVMQAEPLDSRLIKKLVETRIENVNKLIAKLDEENERVKQQGEKRATESAKDRFFEIAKYSFNKNRDLSQEEIKKILNI